MALLASFASHTLDTVPQRFAKRPRASGQRFNKAAFLGSLQKCARLFAHFFQLFAQMIRMAGWFSQSKPTSVQRWHVSKGQTLDSKLSVGVTLTNWLLIA